MVHAKKITFMMYRVHNENIMRLSFTCMKIPKDDLVIVCDESIETISINFINK